MRLFIAVDINEELRTAVADLQKKFKDKTKKQTGIKWVNPKLMHLTLKFLGETDEGKIDDINTAVEIACKDKQPFEFNFAKVGTFSRPARVLWLGSEKQNENLANLARDIEDTLESLGFEKEQREFNAHLTLARIKDHSAGRLIQQIAGDFAKVNLPPISVNSACLYKSQLTPDGPVYTLLNEFKI
ncbi:MAG: RNA 2',3'-cyclic phosphodiesterase [Sedimentisphaerales bacterium]|nr:RNA 2',3'-cyclic phosphodiesterase [Sedimentisphaerales bacterium]